MNFLKNKNIYYLALANLVLRVVAQGLLPLYPVLLKTDTISKLWIGYFMAGIYLFTFLGNWFSGVLLNYNFDIKKLLLLSYIPIAIGLLGMGFQSTYANLFYFAILMSFFNGVNINLNTIILGCFSDSDTIAKNFAWVGLSSILATLFGGLLIGPVLHQYGNSIGFGLFAILFFSSSYFSFKLDAVELHASKSLKKVTFKYKSSFVLLMASMFFLALLIHFFKISLSLKLKELGYNISDISLFSTFGTVLVLPIPFLLSHLNKKIKAKTLLLSFSVITMLSFALVYYFTQSYIIILGISGISYLAYCVRIPLMKMLHEMYDEFQFPKAQTFYASLAWLSAIVGYLIAGTLLELLGFDMTFMVGGILALISGLLLQFGVKHT